jgi:hypothetical protein
MQPIPQLGNPHIEEDDMCCTGKVLDGCGALRVLLTADLIVSGEGHVLCSIVEATVLLDS